MLSTRRYRKCMNGPLTMASWSAHFSETVTVTLPDRQNIFRSSGPMGRLKAVIIPAAAACLILVLWSASARAQTDEIQVYDAEIAEPGTFNLMVHNNFTPSGLKTPRFPGGLVPN